MNRAQRRKFNKKYKTNYSASDFHTFELLQLFKEGRLDIQEIQDNADLFQVHLDPLVVVPDHTQVKIDYQAFTSRPQKDYAENFKIWMSEHQDEIFEIRRDNSSAPNLVQLCSLDKTEPETWLFDIYTDLLYQTNEGSWIPWDNKFFMTKLQQSLTSETE